MKILLIISVIVFIGEYIFAQDGYKTQQPSIDIIYECKANTLRKDYKIFISNNGKVTVFNKDYYTKELYRNFDYTIDSSKIKPHITTKSADISMEELDELKRLVVDANVFNLKSEYIKSPNTIDYKSELITFIIDGKTKKILCSVSSLPLKLSRIIYKIREIEEKIK